MVAGRVAVAVAGQLAVAGRNETSGWPASGRGQWPATSTNKAAWPAFMATQIWPARWPARKESNMARTLFNWRLKLLKPAA